jgi:hypothetical protein
MFFSCLCFYTVVSIFCIVSGNAHITLLDTDGPQSQDKFVLKNEIFSELKIRKEIEKTNPVSTLDLFFLFLFWFLTPIFF